MQRVMIPFGGVAGPNSGPSGDGTIHTLLPFDNALSAVSSSYSSSGAKLYHGNADANGNITYHNVTSAAGNDTIDDLMLFDGTSPAKDVMCVELITGDVIDSVDLYQTTAGVYTGMAVGKVWYKGSSGSWVDGTITATPVFTSTGLKRIQFNPISYADVAFTDDLIDPRNNMQTKCIFIGFTGVTVVTTPPAFSRMWKRRSSTSSTVVTNFTALVNQGDSPNFTPHSSLNIFPLTGDITLVGFDNPVALTQVRINRARNTAWQSELVYSKADGTFGVYPSADVILSSASIGDEIWTAAPTTPNSWVRDYLVPQSDWGKRSIIDKDGVAHNRFWYGWRYTADAVSPQSILLASARAQQLSKTSSSHGVKIDETGTFQTIEVCVRETSPSPARFLVFNMDSGKSVSATLPANTQFVSASISLDITSGNHIGVQQIQGDAVVNVADGYVALI